MPIHVLFVEDEDDLRSVVVEALTSQGFQVTPASNGDEALVLLRGDARFAVVVTDFNMPDSADGLEVAAEAAVAQPQARVMLASGLQRSQLPEKVRFLPKPYRFRQLVTAIHEDLGCT
ncbi:response regulator [Stenotrophomonas maltophilia]|uniref:response regulator n=1 Tax=Stenotrophomonas maltophilia TaxID=40324 RepID=UPI000C160385|nr:response regulator [Stenotrophomonas maltophilia]